MPDVSRITVSVVYAEPEHVFTAEVSLPQGATVAEAIEGSGIRGAGLDAPIRGDRLGIFGRKASFDTVLHEGDRVEIYRPLRIDPKEARRRRARGR